MDLSDLQKKSLWEMQFDDTEENENKRKRFSTKTTLDRSVAFVTYMVVPSHFNPSRGFTLST